MSSFLPIGVEELLGGAVETARLELKASWNADATGHQVIRTLCAFANDLQNLNGGYIVLGVEERDGAAVRPARGLTDAEMEKAQKWVRGNCNRIEPVYTPVMDVVALDGKRVLVLWAPASDVRPHQAPRDSGSGRHYWVRIYPGPVPGIERAHLTGEAMPPPVPARNRRIGELLKELRLAEGRGTGLPKIRRSMSENGSPPPVFDYDEARSYFRVTLPAHPEYVALRVLREYAYKQATGDAVGAQAIVEEAWSNGMRSPSLTTTLVRERAKTGDLAGAEAVLADIGDLELTSHASAFTALATAYADVRDEAKSKSWLNRLPPLLAARDAFDAAILERRLGRQDRAHRLFERAGDLVLQDGRALHEFAQTKLNLASGLSRSQRPADDETRDRLLREAVAYLELVLQMDTPPTRRAWAWFHLGQARQWLLYPRQSVSEAYRRACEMMPDEPRFQEALTRFDSERP